MICHGCKRPVQGNASINGDPYCHPDEGLDCYHLTTVYGVTSEELQRMAEPGMTTRLQYSAMRDIWYASDGRLITGQELYTTTVDAEPVPKEIES